MSINGGYSDPNLMIKLAKFRMPFGKYKDLLLIDLPLPYLDWFLKKGLPEGELGELMRIIQDVKSGDMEHLLDRVRRPARSNGE